MSIKEEPIYKVLYNYDFEVTEVKNESYKEKKGVWWVETSRGLKVLKKISNSEETFNYILAAIKHLSGNGINIPEVTKTKDGKDYVKVNDVCYVLSSAIIGKNPSYDSPKELEAIVKELAKFHKASVGFLPEQNVKPKKHIGTWVEDYHEQIEDMNNFYNKKVSELDKFIVEEFPYFYKRAHAAIEGLKGEDYLNWVKKLGEKGCLCHQDFAAGNLILDSQGQIFVLDTDSITIDIPARDIRKLLNKIMKKKGEWNIELTKTIFHHYQSENPLSKSEWNVVKLDLMFPHLFIGALNKYCYQRDKEWSFDKYLKRINEMSSLERLAVKILDNFEMLIPL